MKITDRDALDVLCKSGIGSLQEIQEWMNKKQQASLRDQFAMHAPITLDEASSAVRIVDGKSQFPTGQEIMDYIVALRFAYADSMLAERAKESK